jgi:hypothetical protein
VEEQEVVGSTVREEPGDATRQLWLLLVLRDCDVESADRGIAEDRREPARVGARGAERPELRVAVVRHGDDQCVAVGGLVQGDAVAWGGTRRGVKASE